MCLTDHDKQDCQNYIGIDAQGQASPVWQLPIGLPVRAYQSQCMTWAREGLVSILPASGGIHLPALMAIIQHGLLLPIVFLMHLEVASSMMRSRSQMSVASLDLARVRHRWPGVFQGGPAERWRLSAI